MLMIQFFSALPSSFTDVIDECVTFCTENDFVLQREDQVHYIMYHEKLVCTKLSFRISKDLDSRRGNTSWLHFKC